MSDNEKENNVLIGYHYIGRLVSVHILSTYVVVYLWLMARYLKSVLIFINELVINTWMSNTCSDLLSACKISSVVLLYDKHCINYV